MHQLRSDVAPLPIAELASIHFESIDPDEPILLGGGDAQLAVSAGFALSALRRRGATSFASARSAALHAVIAPTAIVRTAVIDDVSVAERVAVFTNPTGVAFQWTVDGDAELDLPGFGAPTILAGTTLTQWIGTDAAPDLLAAFRTTAAELARVTRTGVQTNITSVPSGTSVSTDLLAWARARLALHATARTPVALEQALAALATGQFEQVRAQLAHAPAELLPLLAARYAAWTGDIRSVSAHWPAIRAATDALIAAPPTRAPVLRLAALTEMERTATDLGQLGYAADLHSAVKRARIDAAGQPSAQLDAAILTALRTLEPRTRIAPEAGSEDVAFHSWLSWAALEQGLDAGHTGWERLIEEATRPVRGAWPRHFAEPSSDPSATALFVTTLVYGLLGIEPDAPRHRIRIRPRIGTSASMTARSIAFGDGSVSVRVERDARAISIHVVQEAGAIPTTVLLEPIVAGPVTATWIDRQPASLDVRPYGDGVVVPVQLVLDDERTLTIELESV